jgi:protein CpxP
MIARKLIPVTGALALAAFVGVYAPSAMASATQLAQAAAPREPTAAGATRTKGETVEQRITELHAALKITPDEESKWNGVAQVMRENAAAMQKLTAERAAQAPQSVTAVDDLKAYKKFAQAHVVGLNNLTSSFDTLYDSMPDPQKKVADKVFQSFGHEGAASHS